MKWSRIFWSLLAGVSVSLAGCDKDDPPDDATEDQRIDQTMYGPLDMYGDADIGEDPDPDPDSDMPQTAYGPTPP
ncbi:MAG: hypothetical protein ABIJ56_11840 [Pseudomonadota bacterium]